MTFYIVALILAIAAVAVLIWYVRVVRAAAARLDRANDYLRNKRAHDLARATNHPAGRVLRDKEIDRAGTDWN